MVTDQHNNDTQKHQDYAYINGDHQITLQKIRHDLRHENKVNNTNQSLVSFVGYPWACLVNALAKMTMIPSGTKWIGIKDKIILCALI